MSVRATKTDTAIALVLSLRNNALWAWGRGAMRIVLVLALASVCGGCATVIRGTTDQIGFNSTPSGAEVHTSNGLGCLTPCTLTVKKNEEFIATFEKPGFVPQQIPVTRRSWAAALRRPQAI